MMKDSGRNFVWLEIYLHNGGVTSAADAAGVFLLQELITSTCSDLSELWASATVLDEAAE